MRFYNFDMKKMKKLFICTALSIILFLFTSTGVFAQEMKAKKFDNPQWKRIVFVKFKPDKYPRAKEIIQNYFVKAAVKSATPVPSLYTDIMSGEWDVMFVWDMKEGIEEMNWEISPNDVKAMTALKEVAGGADKAKAILDEFSSLKTSETSYIAKSSGVQ